MMSDLHFADDAKINAVLILQRRIFQLQAEQLEIAIRQQQHEEHTTPQSEAISLPPILVRRNISEEMRSQNRILDDVEMTILGILDCAGMLSLCSRISEFIVVMTRVVKVEHRALCLRILSNCMTPKCGQSFITFGGLRLLKRWIKVAEDEDCVDELRVIVNLCKVLPFDGQALKDTEIGKSIRRLLKFRSSSPNLDHLFADVRNLMQHWTNYVKGVIVSKTSQLSDTDTNEKLPNIVFALSQRLVIERGQPSHHSSTTKTFDNNDIASDFTDSDDVAKHNQLISTDSNIPYATPTEAIGNSTQVQSRQGVLEALAGGKNNHNLAGAAPSSSGCGSGDTTGISGSGLRRMSPSGGPTLPGSSSSFISGPSFGPLVTQGIGGIGGLDIRAAPSAVRRSNTAADGSNIMSEKAKLFIQTQLKNSSVETDLQALSNISSIDPVTIIPLSGCLKGGMKRKLDSKENFLGPLLPSGKKPKLTVMWADENGGTLRDVLTFEVERIKNTIKDYKSHRDLVRKERQLEKDLHLSKTKEAMHPTVEWRKPEHLILSMDIRYCSNLLHPGCHYALNSLLCYSFFLHSFFCHVLLLLCLLALPILLPSFHPPALRCPLSYLLPNSRCGLLLRMFYSRFIPHSCFFKPVWTPVVTLSAIVITITPIN